MQVHRINDKAVCDTIQFTSNVTGFVKRGLPHTSDSLNVEDHNLAIK